jgi:hypothetical protein
MTLACSIARLTFSSIMQGYRLAVKVLAANHAEEVNPD